MKLRKSKYIEWGATVVVALSLFFFFFSILPYHLFHREQTHLFMYAAHPITQYFHHPGSLARLLGDYLTQFFYFEGAAPLIMSLLLTLFGVVVYRLLSKYIGMWALPIALLAVVWEAGRQCGLYYPLWATISLIGVCSVLLFCRWAISGSLRRGLIVSLFALVAGYWLFGYGKWTTMWDAPNLKREYLLAIDSEMYFGRHHRARRLLNEDKLRIPFTSYYYNLLHAQQGTMPQMLMKGYQPATKGLLLSVGPGINYYSLYAANEAWFALGDMTMAEHAAILGMIFSPQHTGARAIKRLAEINLINGDDEAAMKYLRMLQKTMCYKEWAQQRMPQSQTAEVRKWLKRKRAVIPQADTLRSADSVLFSLRQLLRSNPDNEMACHYLLCYDLLHKDIESFANDYKEFAPKQSPSHLYAQGLLVYLAGKKAGLQEVQQFNIPQSTVEQFNKYTHLYQSHRGSKDRMEALRAHYGDTYWFYFHFTVMKDK